MCFIFIIKCFFYRFYRWRNTFEEITKKLQQEVIELQRENSRLITENHKLNKELRRNKI